MEILPPSPFGMKKKKETTLRSESDSLDIINT